MRDGTPVTNGLLAQEGDLAIRLMRDDMEDYGLMARWLTDHRVLAYYEGRDNPFPLERVVEEYGPLVRGEESVVPCILLHQGTPIGYMQYYGLVDYIQYFSLTEEEKEGFGLSRPDRVYGLDVFIGEPDLWDRGLGTRAVSLMVRYLFQRLKADQVVVDPETWNTRAVRCYQKAGFRILKRLPAHELHEGEYRDAWLMAAGPEAASPGPRRE